MERIEKGISEIERGSRTRVVIPRKVRRRPFKRLSEEGAGQLFKAYFNNKMAVVLLLLQNRRPEPDSVTSMKAVIFFDDLYRHLLEAEFQGDFARIFKWLRLFFRRYPYVKPLQKRKAIEYIRVIYRSFGMEWKLEI